MCREQPHRVSPADAGSRWARCDEYRAPNLWMIATQRVIARWVHKEATVFQVHFAVLQQVVQDREHVALSLFDALDDENAALSPYHKPCTCPRPRDVNLVAAKLSLGATREPGYLHRRSDGALVLVERGAVANLAPLLQV